MLRRPLAIACFGLAASAITACNGGPAATPATSPTTSVANARAVLEQIVLQAADAGPGFAQESAGAQTNDDLAGARPDSDAAHQQYADWGQVLQYNVQYSAPVTADLVFSGKIARVMNTATLFASPEGASTALAYIRDLASSTVANFLVNDVDGTKISDTQVVKDIAFPSKGDESYAWRLTGKATFGDGFTVTFVADALFVRAGRVDGNVTAVAFGQAPKRDDLIALADKFVGRARANE
jgi:hypothetical protein